MKFKINLYDIKLLVKIVKNPTLVNKLIKFEETGSFFVKEKYPTGKYIIELSQTEIEAIIDSLSDYFINSGIDNNDKPNDLGLQIESMIDLFYNNNSEVFTNPE